MIVESKTITNDNHIPQIENKSGHIRELQKSLNEEGRNNNCRNLGDDGLELTSSEDMDYDEGPV